MPKLKNSNATFLVIFKHCLRVKEWWMTDLLKPFPIDFQKTPHELPATFPWWQKMLIIIGKVKNPKELNQFSGRESNLGPFYWLPFRKKALMDVTRIFSQNRQKAHKIKVPTKNEIQCFRNFPNFRLFTSGIRRKTNHIVENHQRCRIWFFDFGIFQ